MIQEALPTEIWGPGCLEKCWIFRNSRISNLEVMIIDKPAIPRYILTEDGWIEGYSIKTNWGLIHVDTEGNYIMAWLRVVEHTPEIGMKILEQGLRGEEPGSL